jgi:hypothetical protein
MNKFHHVKSARLQPGETHTCHWPGCKTPIPRAMHMCRGHWNTLPKLLRDRIWDAYTMGQEDDSELVSPEYVDAASAARRWAETYVLASNANFHERT